MSGDQVDHIISRVLVERQEPLDRPNEQDWKALQEKFQCDFSPDFVLFMQYLGSYRFPGEIYDVARSGKTSGNGTIASIYDAEISYTDGPLWNADLIPFYGVGNGDCFCLSASGGEYSPVFYVFHEDGHTEQEYPSFEAFLMGLPDLLND